MKIKFIIIGIAFFVLSMKAQQTVPGGKGISPVSKVILPQSTVHNTYAVVVGISDYQDPSIPDLHFADKDAEAFANYLRSEAGSLNGKGLDPNHLKILLNEQATLGKFAAALDWLLEVCKENDRAIIYFSGHGDVERKTISLPGYLLCWDAPSHIYMSGGAFNLRDLEEIITTLSTQNKAKTIIIADACHAGKLSGAAIGGPQITGANLAKQYSNETKLLSCQPNELSIEGEQWGGGRGAFSFNLVEGLYGLADKNADGIITTGEIDRYLEDHVTPDVLPMIQSPVVLGNKSEPLSKVSTDISAKLQKGKNPLMAILAGTESRGLEEEVLSNLDTSIQNLYRLFKKSLVEKTFFAENKTSHYTDYYFDKLLAEPKLARLHHSMRRNYAAALQDDAQQMLNREMNSDVNQLLIPRKIKAARYQYYPRCLQRAAELLGSQHYMYKSLQARKIFFEAYVLAISHRIPDTSIGRRALLKFNVALDWQPDMPQVYMQKSWVFAVNLLNIDSAEYYAKKAIELYPTWLLPNVQIAYMLSGKFKLFERALPYLENAMKLDSGSALVWNSWGNYFFEQKKYHEAETYFLKSIQLDTNYVDPYYNLACSYSIQNDVSTAFFYLDHALKIGYDYDWIQKDTDLDNIRNLPEWEILMKNYFPEKIKN